MYGLFFSLFRVVESKKVIMSQLDTERLVKVALPRPIAESLTYRMISSQLDRELVGQWVLAPLGRDQVMGCIMEVTVDESIQMSKIKTISAALHWIPQLPPSLVSLIKYIAQYYHVPIGETLKLVMPRWVSRPGDMINSQRDFPEDDSLRSEHSSTQLSLEIDYSQAPPTSDLIERSILEGSLSALKVINHLGPIIQREVPFYIGQKEWVALRESQEIIRLKIPRSLHSPLYSWRLVDSATERPKSKEKVTQEIIAHLSAVESMEHAELLSSLSSRRALTVKKSLRALLDDQQVELLARPLIEEMSSGEISAHSSAHLSQPEEAECRSAERVIELTDEQKLAVEHIEKTEGFSVTLLHGVTGSGKTEVYLEVIEAAIREGKQALVLVPEIGLTPQTVNRFTKRLTCPIYAWHSRLTPKERLQTWRMLTEQRPCVLIGARSALFCPLNSLGVIIVDESHDSSYKQEEGVRYHARDMAVMRGAFEGSTVILGTATPSLESMQNTLCGKYQLVTLCQRPMGASLPTVRVIDLTKSRMITQEATSITNTLAQAISIRLKRGEQTILFLNRRGFSQSVRCVSCGFLFSCPHCLLPLPWHLSSKRLQCHHCDFNAYVPSECPQCYTSSLAPVGRGTERVEQQLHSLFPRANIVRLDQDSELSPEELHSLMNSDRVDILIGTQMVTKGHDFPRVTLVGVIDADVGLDLPDFRANERSYQLLSQVSGRAGRAALSGEVIIQTYRPSEERLLAAISHDYHRFFTYELALREAITYPPFGYLATIRLRGEQGEKLTQALESLSDRLSQCAPSVRVRGPVIAPVIPPIDLRVKLG